MATKKATPVKKAVKAVKAVKATKIAKSVKTHLAAEVDSDKGVRTSVVGLDGRVAGSMTLPAAYFGAKVNKQLLAQAVRVYLANQRVGHASTKTRGEVEGSTRKIYRQKGTGKARHGGIRAPIFVGGGIVFGPKPRDYSLELPHKMKQVALAGALTQQLGANNVVIVSGLSDLEPKTKLVAQTLAAVGANETTLLVTAKESGTLVRSARNIEDVDVLPVTDLNTYSVLTHGKIVFMKEAIKELRK